MKFPRYFLPFALFSTVLNAQDTAAWSFRDADGSRDVLFAGKIVLRHMNAWNPARRDETFKPYLHVFDFDGGAPITKGPGGQFTHHRGIFIGWNKVSLAGKSYDFWHCKNVIRKHTGYVAAEETADAKHARMVSLTDWPTPDGKVVIREKQTVTASYAADRHLQLDVSFQLDAPSGPVKLDGDVQHAGVHFRAAQPVEKTQAQTVYLMQADATSPKKDIWENLNWVVCNFVLGDKKYAVAHFSDSKNPQPLQYSTRAYGRFGAFPKMSVEPGKPLNLRYRFIVCDTTAAAAPTAAEWQQQWEAFNSGK